MNINNYIPTAYLRNEIRSMVKSYRWNQQWARVTVDEPLDPKVPCAEWCHNEAAQPVTDKLITDTMTPAATERTLNTYRLARYHERAEFYRYAGIAA